MTAARLFAVTALLAMGACATPSKALVVPTPRYELCNDPAFQCDGAVEVENAIQIDTNFATARPAPSVG